MVPKLAHAPLIISLIALMIRDRILVGISGKIGYSFTEVIFVVLNIEVGIERDSNQAHSVKLSTPVLI